jgi:hypothetical protein
MRAEAEGPARIEKRPRLERGAGGKPGAAGPPSEGERGARLRQGYGGSAVARERGWSERRLEGPASIKR